MDQTINILILMKSKDQAAELAKEISTLNLKFNFLIAEKMNEFLRFDKKD